MPRQVNLLRGVQEDWAYTLCHLISRRLTSGAARQLVKHNVPRFSCLCISLYSCPHPQSLPLNRIGFGILRIVFTRNHRLPFSSTYSPLIRYPRHSTMLAQSTRLLALVMLSGEDGHADGMEV